MLVLILVAGGLLWVGRGWWDLRRSRRALAEARREIQAGRPGRAARTLADLLARQPDSDEAAYLLGNCEKERGRFREAAEAWARVPRGSPWAPRAIQGRAELEIGRGRLADAEQLITEAMKDPRIAGSGLPLSLALLAYRQGRVADAEQLLEASWDRLRQAGAGASERAIQLVRLHIRTRLEPLPVEAITAFLDQAQRQTSGDDRVWLARADLATRAGAHDEAQRWLEACRRIRPPDVPVWRVRLSLAVATDRVAAARQAAERIPAAMATEAEVHRLAAWLAARRGDAEAERRALGRLVAADPADFQALDRLAQLALHDRRPDRAAELRRRKAEITRLQARYRELDQRNQPIRDSVRMARLAAQLGQRFEAKAFLTIAVAAQPRRDDLRAELARLDHEDRITAQAGRTLAEVLAPDLDATDPAGTSVRPDSPRVAGPQHGR
jgi:thioredoxin-like negative regulator of GroEL